MKHAAYKPYLYLLITLAFLVSLPRGSVEVLQSGMVILAKPFYWKMPSLIANTFSKDDEASDLPLSESYLKLQHENEILKEEVSRLQDLFEHELFLLTQLSSQLSNGGDLAAMVEKHQQEVTERFSRQLTSIPAHVIFRPPASWSSSLWIDAGSTSNEEYKAPVIGKNSPVVVGNALIGVIDYVGKSQSRVRLITDAGVTPSVRVARGCQQNIRLIENIQLLLGTIAARHDLFADNNEKTRWLARLEKLKNVIAENEQESWLLAKGELHGSSEPLWRSKSQKLQGLGFNYDFADDEGPARDLRSGEPIHAPETIPALPLITTGDLLITTGLDGVFPKGLHVGTVSRVAPLKEGDYTYSIDALPIAGNLDNLSLVFVLPPTAYNPHDQPPIIGR